MALVTVQRSPTPSTSSSPCVSESGSGEDDRRSQQRSISESFLTVKGAALFLPRGNGSSLSTASRFSQLRSKHAGDIQQHLQTMFTVLRPEDNIKLAVRLESTSPQVTRYMVVVSTNGRQDTEESVVLGMDFSPVDGSCSVGLVLPLWSDTLIHLDGDGGFSVSTDNRIHVFKPVSVQAMWSALQSLHKACEVARCHNYFPGSLFLTWFSYYQSRVSSDQARINEWNAMQDVQSHRADSPVLFSDIPTERELTERQIKTSLREIMTQRDLENITCKEIRTELEMRMTCNLREFKEFIDNEMIVILGQMDSPTEIFDHVFLGSEWNASNLEELQKSGVQYILNVTKEIDNFFPGVFEYHNIRVYDEEATDLLAYWNDTYKFISRAKKSGARCLVHCKMGISRSAATVIAYAMKEYGWDLKKALAHVKERRSVTKPNPSFMRQLEEYQGILLASKQRHNKLWRSHSDSDLSEHHEPLSKCYAQPHSLGRSDPHNQACLTPGQSMKELLESLGTPGKTTPSTGQTDTGFQLNPLASSSSFEGLAALSGDAEARRLKSSSLTGHFYSMTSSTPPSNTSCDLQEQTSAPSLSAPTTAISMPETLKNNAVTFAQSFPVSQSSPPSSGCHTLPSSGPSAVPTHTDGSPKPQAASCSPPATKSAVGGTTQAPSTQAEPQSTSALGPLKKADGSKPASELSEDSAIHPPPANDLISAMPQDNVLLFGHSTDHINFFRAREKFKGMSQDGKVGVAAMPKSCGKENQSLLQEVPTGEGKDDEKRKETTLPVQLAGMKPVEPHCQPESQGSQGQKGLIRSEHQDEELVGQQDSTDGRGEAKSREDDDAAAARLCSDWTRGSVRRVTQQLEQRMKKEHENPSPASSPPSLSGCSSRPQRRPHSIHTSTASTAPSTSLTIQPSAAGTAKADDRGKPGVVAKGGALAAVTAIQENSDKCPTGVTFQSADARWLPTSSQLRYSAKSPFASVNFLCLEGVTELESSTEWDCLVVGAHGDVILRETLETLCELGAFLQQVSMDGTCKGRPVGQSAGAAQKGGSSFHKRAREVGARIRQAGLTPPSLMKRSASLAKLGCLELLANDLNDWELSCSLVTTPSEQAPAHTAIDESKKQRVHNSTRPKGEQPKAPRTPEKMNTHDNHTSSPGAPLLSSHNHQIRRLLSAGQDAWLPSGPTLLTTRQQYGRTHPLRRLKKRTTNTPYHTM